MKKLKINTLLFFAGVTLVFLGCKKEPETLFISKTNPVPTVAYTSPRDFNLKMMPATQSFKIDASKAIKITTASGSTFSFDAGSFYNTSGLINSGNIDIKITEVNKTSEMMATGAGTEATNGILASAGMFKIEASMNGTPVALYMLRPIKVEIPASNDAKVDGFKLFKGIENSTKDKVTWVEAPQDSSGTSDSIRLEKIGQKKIFSFRLNFLNWCNLDRFFNATGGESIRVKIEGDYGNLNTNVYVLFTLPDGPKGMVQLFSNQDKKEWNTSNYNLPYNNKYTLICTAINLVTKQLEYAIMDMQHQADKTYTFEKLTPISEEDLEAKFKALK